MVMKFVGTTNNPGYPRYITDNGDNTGFHMFERVATTGLLNIGATTFDIAANTNKWMVWDFAYSAAFGSPHSSYCYTNNAVAATDDGNAYVGNGFTLSSDGGFFGDTAPCNVAFLVIYGATTGSSNIPGTNTTARTSVFSALTNYFNLSP